MLKKKFTSNSSIIKIPAYIGAIGSILLISIGLFVVRGFEGAAYLFLAITILAFAVMTFKQLAK
ncbi:hypothetical protein CWS01_14650 [Niallia nealsonii]|uniref:Uncharacterized protein n=2 Tax=Niallia nealsonii TaxID=115979 RepID=A0A2N0Z0H8_9BACI|nr:hypothetical protein CWS01_14650 [Niallia nealsonii]